MYWGARDSRELPSLVDEGANDNRLESTSAPIHLSITRYELFIVDSIPILQVFQFVFVKHERSLRKRHSDSQDRKAFQKAYE